MIMTPVHNLPQQGWMDDAAIARLFALLQDDGGAVPPQLLFVGGCVRNAVLGLPPGDMDLATVHRPDAVIERLSRGGVKVVPTGIDHGTVTAVVDGRPFEITTLRRDVATDGRRAVVAFTDDWAEDAARRDFTMNTLLMDRAGRVYDPLGLGLADALAGRVVFVGNPAQRIAEDYLRILRFFRFYGAYGRGEPDVAALAACRAAAGEIPRLSRERITQEVLKITMLDKAVDIFNILFENNILSDFSHVDYDAGALARLIALQGTKKRPDVAARLALFWLGYPEYEIPNYILLSNNKLKKLKHIIMFRRAPLTTREALYRLGRETGEQALLAHAALGGMDDVDLASDWTIPALPLDGNALQAIGIPAGPRMGEILKQVEDWWIAHDFNPGPDDCLNRARAISAAPGRV